MRSEPETLKDKAHVNSFSQGFPFLELGKKFFQQNSGKIKKFGGKLFQEEEVGSAVGSAENLQKCSRALLALISAFCATVTGGSTGVQLFS